MADSTQAATGTLATHPAMGNNSLAPSHYGVRLGGLIKSADSRYAAFFVSVTHTIGAPFFMAGHGGGVIVRAGSDLPVRQPCHVPASPLGGEELGSTLKSEATMPSISLRVLRTFSRFPLVRRSLIRACLHGRVSAITLVRMIGGAA